MLRAIVLTAFLALYLVYAWRDNAWHGPRRAVPRGEHATHLGILVAVIALAVGAFRGHPDGVLAGALGVCVFGGLDEYVFHHGLPGEESDLHAKGHLALFLFTVAALAVDRVPQWLRASI